MSETTFSETQYADQLSELNTKLAKAKDDIVAIRGDIDAQLSLAKTYNYSTRDLFDQYMAILNLKSEELAMLSGNFTEIKNLFDSSVQTIVANEHRHACDLQQCEATLASLHASLTTEVALTRENMNAIRTEINDNVVRVNDAQSRFDAFLAVARQLYALYQTAPPPPPTPTPTPPPMPETISRYNGDYFCKFWLLEHHPDRLRLGFHVMGNNSLGHIQPPSATVIRVDGVEHGQSGLHLEVDDPASNIRGWVEFAVAVTAPSVEVKYGTSGYSWAPLVLPVSPQPPVEVISRYNDDYFCKFSVVERHVDRLRLAFHVTGNNSLGAIQSPSATVVRVDGVDYPSTNVHLEVNDPASNISGWLEFAVAAVSATHAEVKYGSNGYSWAALW